MFYFFKIKLANFFYLTYSNINEPTKTTYVISYQERLRDLARRRLSNHPKQETVLIPKGVFTLKIRRMFRSEEHTSELQSRFDLVCRLLLEKKKDSQSKTHTHKSVKQYK